MFSITNKELSGKKKAGKYAKCQGCGERHVIINAKKKSKNGLYVEDSSIGYIKCSNGKMYLATIDGKLIF